MLALIAAVARRPCTVRSLRSFSTESLNPFNDVSPPPSSPTIPAATIPFALAETSKEEWVDNALHYRDDPPKGKAFPKMSFPGAMKLDIPKYRLHCKSSHNNTIITFTNDAGNTIAWQSGGRCGFKGTNRASYEAGYQSAVRIFQVIQNLANRKDFNVALYFKGFGQGRDALKTALLAVEGLYIRPLISSATDRTPIKIGGTRAKKTRRL